LKSQNQNPPPERGEGLTERTGEMTERLGGIIKQTGGTTKRLGGIIKRTGGTTKRLGGMTKRGEEMMERPKDGFINNFGTYETSERLKRTTKTISPGGAEAQSFKNLVVSYGCSM